MRQEFYSIYQELFSSYQQVEGDSDAAFWRHVIADIIEQQAQALEIDSKLRPDASFFLLVNFYELVIKPTKMGQRSFQINQDRNNDDLQGMLRHDLRIVLRSCKQSTERISREREEDDRKISGHDVVNTISRVWDRLYLVRIDVWGAS
jgi:hypothetical protein